MFIGKIFYFLPEIVSKKLQDNETIENVKKLIIEVYEMLDPTKDQKMVKSIVTKFDSIKANTLKDSLINKIIRFNYLIPPFNTPDFKNIKKAAKLLNIPLTEKLFIPELGVWTKTEVAVGPAYFSTLEQLSSDYESTRGVAGYVSATGQPPAGKSRVGGQSLNIRGL
jgi:DNA-directed RNA polymerase beta subunit